MFRDRVDLSFAELPAALREDAMHRFAVLRPHLEENVSLAATAKHADVPLRTVQRWLARYRTEGLVGLARECPVFCVWLSWSMLPERSEDDDDFQRPIGRTFEGLCAA